MNITVDFGDSRQVLYVSSHFRSLTPYGMVIYYSEDGVQFSPRQYLAFDCEALFGLDRNAPLTSPTDINCISSYNIPEYERYVQFLVLDEPNRPGVQSYFENSELIQFSLARMVRLQLFGWHTYEGLQSNLLTQHFSLYELYISGEVCLCNGHASQCSGTSCVCEHNTMGPSCTSCLPLFNNRPWAAGTIASANECEMCECNQHASACVYDTELGAGRCLSCRDNTQGTNCQECVPFYYNPAGIPQSASDACQPCDCFSGGITDDGQCQQDGSGQCSCKMFVTGRRCDQCADGFFNFDSASLVGCEPCGCNTNGTVDGSGSCSATTGQCNCLPNVVGRNCSNCIQHFYGFGSPEGCRACDPQCSDEGCSGPGPQNCIVSTG